MPPPAVGCHRDAAFAAGVMSVAAGSLHAWTQDCCWDSRSAPSSACSSAGCSPRPGCAPPTCEAARAQALLEAERHGAQARLADSDRLADQFRALAADALATSTDQFLALAHQRFAADHQTQVGELAQREQAVRAMVEPLSRTLDQVRVELSTAEQARAAGQAALGEQVRAMHLASEHLRGETAQLVTALRSSQVRGKWGELQLKRVVEAAGMLAHVDFVEQDQVRTDDGLLRPDMVIKLAGGKNVVVDAKVAFLGFLDAAQATDERVRTERLAAHARHVRAHVDDLAGKRYWDQFAPAPEFVVMFVPAESFLHAAAEQDPLLIEYAFERNVVIATPTTLLALLRTVSYAWRQDALASNAQAVLSLGKELHGRLATMGAHLAKLGPRHRLRRRRLQPDGVVAGDAGPGQRPAVRGPARRRRGPADARPREPAAVGGQRTRARGVGRRADRHVRRPRRPRRARPARRGATQTPDARPPDPPGRDRRAERRRGCRRRDRDLDAGSAVARGGGSDGLDVQGRAALAARDGRGLAGGLEVGAELARQREHEVLGRGADLLDVAEAVLGEQGRGRRGPGSPGPRRPT